MQENQEQNKTAETLNVLPEGDALVVTAENLVPKPEASKPEKVLSKIDQINANVDKKLKTEAPTEIFAAIVQTKYEARKKSVQASVEEGLRRRETLQKELKQLLDKPEQEFDADGKVTRSWYGKEASSKIKQLRQNLEKLESALNKFLETGDAQSLENVVKPTQDNKQEKGKSEEPAK